MVRKVKSKTPAPLPTRQTEVSPPLNWLVVRGARQHNLKGIDVPFPLGAFSVVTGVSGSGKSSLVNDILWKTLARQLHRAQTIPGACDFIEGIEFVNKVIRVDQQPIGQTPTSNPATYTGVFDIIREHFARLPEAKVRGYMPRRFSFNVPGGRCEKCEGAGQIKIEMHFLPDVWITCDACAGKRYEPQTLSVQYKGHSIADVLEMSCAAALRLFENIPEIRRVLQTLCDVGLDYLALGQPAPTLSGGEAQRIKLATELARPDTGRTLYLLDEPTTGLHFNDLKKLLEVLHRLADVGNTVIVIEHNLDVIKNADWLVDLGPEAGQNGGELVFAGTPEEMLKKLASGKKGKSSRTSPQLSHTAQALAPVWAAGPFEERNVYRSAETKDDTMSHSAFSKSSSVFHDETAKMPWETDGPRWHTQDRVNRRGGAVRWDGQILCEVIKRIEDSHLFAPTNWNDRSVVEIRAEKKPLGWFFHAITGEEWLLKMKFRTARNTFRKETLIPKLDLKPLNEMDAIPLYGTEPRVRVMRSGSSWQEIELRVHSFGEIDRQEFWDFLELAIQGFTQFTKKYESKPEDLMPWKILGKKWHFLPKGLNGGDKLLWDYPLLTEILSILTEAAPLARTVWTNKSLVPIYIPKENKPDAAVRTLPWVVIHTKRVDAVYVEIYVKKNTMPLGRVRSFGIAPQVLGENSDYDIVRLKFAQKKDVDKQELQKILRETLEG